MEEAASKDLIQVVPVLKCEYKLCRPDQMSVEQMEVEKVRPGFDQQISRTCQRKPPLSAGTMQLTLKD